MRIAFIKQYKRYSNRLSRPVFSLTGNDTDIFPTRYFAIWKEVSFVRSVDENDFYEKRECMLRVRIDVGIARGVSTVSSPPVFVTIKQRVVFAFHLFQSGFRQVESIRRIPLGRVRKVYCF